MNFEYFNRKIGKVYFLFFNLFYGDYFSNLHCQKYFSNLMLSITIKFEYFKTVTVKN